MALRASQASAAPSAPRASPAAGGGIARLADAPAPRASVVVRYLGAAPIVVRGAVTGRAYSFAAGRPIQPVDARDVAGLLKKGLFRRGG
jgi:hypothetical protein